MCVASKWNIYHIMDPSPEFLEKNFTNFPPWIFNLCAFTIAFFCFSHLKNKEIISSTLSHFCSSLEILCCSSLRKVNSSYSRQMDQILATLFTNNESTREFLQTALREQTSSKNNNNNLLLLKLLFITYFTNNNDNKLSVF